MENLLRYRPPQNCSPPNGSYGCTLVFFSARDDTAPSLQAYWRLSIIGGFTIMMWAWFQFQKAKTAVCPTAETTAFVTGGAYQICRNPMYLGMLFMLAGISFFMGTIQAFLAPAAFFLIMDKIFIPYEEKKLQKGFADRYAVYSKQTRRWI